MFLGCTDPITANFISARSGIATVSVNSEAKQLNSWRVSDYTPEYRRTQSIGKRPVLTEDEVMRLGLDEELIIIRGQKVLRAEKYDFTRHPESKKLIKRKAAEHIPNWQQHGMVERDYTPSIPKPARKAHKPKPVHTPPRAVDESYLAEADPDDFLTPVDKNSIMSE